MRARRSCADALAGAIGAGAAQERTNIAKRTGDPRELQGIRTGRNADQRAPAWDRPAGADAADELLRAIRGWPR